MKEINKINNIISLPSLCCFGHITKDRIITGEKIVNSPGGTAYYFTHAVKIFEDVEYKLYTIIGKQEEYAVNDLINNGVKVEVNVCEKSVFFENIYNANLNERKQRVLSKSEPFTADKLENLEASIIHLGPLLNDDFSMDVLSFLSKKSELSLDVQGFLRTVDDRLNVIPVNWKEKQAVLKNIHYLKANEYELITLTGTDKITEGIKLIYNWGVKEVIVTLGDKGSIIFDGINFNFIPAYKPAAVIDATGCGDTYMAGYLYSRVHNKSIEESGNFGAAMATLKIGHFGPFCNLYSDIQNCMLTSEKTYPNIVIS